MVGRDQRPTPTLGGDAIVEAMAASLRASLRSSGIAASEASAVACSAPGPLSYLTGVVHQAPNLAGMTDYPLARRLSDALAGLPVFLDRDTVMAAIGEALAGAAVGVRDFVYITVSSGLGGAIVSGGRLLRGPSLTAGEVGHWPVALDGPPCGCGSFGCAESLASGHSIARHLGVADAREVYDRYDRGDARATAVVERAERALEALAVGVVNALNPSLIVVGGSVAEHRPVHVLEPMRRGVAARALRAPAAAVRVVPAALGADVSLVGAVMAARARMAGKGEWFLL